MTQINNKLTTLASESYIDRIPGAYHDNMSAVYHDLYKSHTIAADTLKYHAKRSSDTDSAAVMLKQANNHTKLANKYRNRSAKHNVAAMQNFQKG